LKCENVEAELQNETAHNDHLESRVIPDLRSRLAQQLGETCILERRLRETEARLEESNDYLRIKDSEISLHEKRKQVADFSVAFTNHIFLVSSVTPVVGFSGTVVFCMPKVHYLNLPSI